MSLAILAVCDECRQACTSERVKDFLVVAYNPAQRTRVVYKLMDHTVERLYDKIRESGLKHKVFCSHSCFGRDLCTQPFN